jgi:predicted transcriptional regulator
MTSKKKNKIEEPAEAYEVTPKSEVILSNFAWEQLPGHVQKAIELGIEQAEIGLVFTHEEVMSNLKKKYPFLNGI